MPTTSGPFTAAPGAPVVVSNPSQGGGNVAAGTAVIVNLSPYVLIVASGANAATAIVDPATRDMVTLSASSGAQIVVTPTTVGLPPIAGLLTQFYVIWYGAAEAPPSGLPVPIGGFPQTTFSGFGKVVLTRTGAGGAVGIANLPGIYRQAKIYSYPVAGTAPILEVSLAQPPGSPVFVLDQFIVTQLAAATVIVAQPIVVPLIPQGPTMGVELFLTDLGVTTEFIVVVLDTEPVADGLPHAPFPWWQGLEIPKAPTLTASAVALGTLVAAPTYGALYVFGWWANVNVTAAAEVQLLAAGNAIDGFVFPPGPSTWMNYNSPPLGPIRTTGAISVAVTAGGPLTIQSLGVRYALGP